MSSTVANSPVRPASGVARTRLSAATTSQQRSRLVGEWHQHLRTMNRVHREMQADAGKRARSLAMATTVISAVVGTSIFTTIESSPAVGWKIAVGMLSIAGAVFGAIQSSLNLADRQAQHQSAAEAFGQLRREIEIWGALGSVDTLDAKDLKEFVERWNNAEAGAPSIPTDKYWESATKVSQDEQAHPVV